MHLYSFMDFLCVLRAFLCGYFVHLESLWMCTFCAFRELYVCYILYIARVLLVGINCSSWEFYRSIYFGRPGSFMDVYIICILKIYACLYFVRLCSIMDFMVCASWKFYGYVYTPFTALITTTSKIYSHDVKIWSMSHSVAKIQKPELIFDAWKLLFTKSQKFQQFFLNSLSKQNPIHYFNHIIHIF